VLPPQEATRNPASLSILGERRERAWLALVERVDCGLKPVDHRHGYRNLNASRRSGTVRCSPVAKAPVSAGREAQVTETGEYRFFAGWRSDPFFFDAEGALNDFQFNGQDFFADKESAALCWRCRTMPREPWEGSGSGTECSSPLATGTLAGCRWIAEPGLRSPSSFPGRRKGAVTRRRPLDRQPVRGQLRAQGDGGQRRPAQRSAEGVPIPRSTARLIRSVVGEGASHRRSRRSRARVASPTALPALRRLARPRACGAAYDSGGQIWLAACVSAEYGPAVAADAGRAGIGGDRPTSFRCPRVTWRSPRPWQHRRGCLRARRRTAPRSCQHREEATGREGSHAVSGRGAGHVRRQEAERGRDPTREHDDEPQPAQPSPAPARGMEIGPGRDCLRNVGDEYSSEELGLIGKPVATWMPTMIDSGTPSTTEPTTIPIEPPVPSLPKRRPTT
jgi:hypothetical protein